MDLKRAAAQGRMSLRIRVFVVSELKAGSRLVVVVKSSSDYCRPARDELERRGKERKKSVVQRFGGWMGAREIERRAETRRGQQFIWLWLCRHDFHLVGTGTPCAPLFPFPIPSRQKLSDVITHATPVRAMFLAESCPGAKLELKLVGLASRPYKGHLRFAYDAYALAYGDGMSRSGFPRLDKLVPRQLSERVRVQPFFL